MTKICVCTRNENFCFVAINMCEKMTEIKKSSSNFKKILDQNDFEVISWSKSYKKFGHRRSDSRPPMPYQNDGHIFAVISKCLSYIISKWKSLWEHTPPFFCLFAVETAGRDLSTVQSTEGLLFTNPGSAAKISLAEDRRKPDENYSFMGIPFQPTVRCLILSHCLVCCNIEQRTAGTRRRRELKNS